ncbi:MAG: dephospho-CoA kinase [Victivallaceae bacterium]|nr:dephospho-CoA kinase [Victivallaceae bacterium]
MIAGLTGSFGSGKSTAGALFAKLGWFVFDSDEFCRTMRTTPDAGFLAAAASLWNGCCVKDGKIDAKAVSDVVFGNPERMREWLGIVYPRLDMEMDRLTAECRESGRDAIFELPMLYEAGMEKRFDCVISVWAPDRIRGNRLGEGRAIVSSEKMRRDAMQLLPEEKLSRGDYGIVNIGSLGLLEMQVERLDAKLRENKRKSYSPMERE